MADRSAPARLKDFDRIQNAAALYGNWHQQMNGQVSFNMRNFPVFYSAIDAPLGLCARLPRQKWTILPRTIKGVVAPRSRRRRSWSTTRARSARSTQSTCNNTIHSAMPVSIRFSGRPTDRRTSIWNGAVRRDNDGVVSEVAFTANGPEYSDQIAEDKDLLTNSAPVTMATWRGRQAPVSWGALPREKNGPLRNGHRPWRSGPGLVMSPGMEDLDG